MAEVFISAFLARHARTQFKWGSHDCLMWLADWIAEVRGVDPAASWRGTYRGWFGAARIIHEAGSMARHVDRVVAPLGIVRTPEPKRGDIAVVMALEGERGALVLGASVARIAERGLVVGRLPIIAAWGV